MIHSIFCKIWSAGSTIHRISRKICSAGSKIHRISRKIWSAGSLNKTWAAGSKIHLDPRSWIQRILNLGSFWDLGTSLFRTNAFLCKILHRTYSIILSIILHRFKWIVWWSCISGADSTCKNLVPIVHSLSHEVCGGAIWLFALFVGICLKGRYECWL